MFFKFKKIILFTAKEFVLRPDLTFNEVYTNLERDIDFVDDSVFRHGLFAKIRNQKFEGELTKEDFSIQRITDYRNGLAPIINGYFETENSKPVIYVEIKSGLAIVVIFYILLFSIGFTILKYSIFVLDVNILVPSIFAMIFMIYGVLMYHNECDKAIEELKEILEIEDLQ